MLAALPQPLEVQEVGGSSFLEGLVGPALIAVAAIVAAALAAWVARRNHAEQLANDRDLRDLDHARLSLSGAVETVAGAVRVLGDLHQKTWRARQAREASVKLGEEADGFWPPHPRTEQQEEAIGDEAHEMEAQAIAAHSAAIEEEMKVLRAVQETQQVAWRFLDNLHADGFRLRITIGEGSEVVEKHENLSAAFTEWDELLAIDKDGNFHVEGDPGGRVNPPDVPIPERITEFIDACQKWSADRSGH